MVYMKIESMGFKILLFMILLMPSLACSQNREKDNPWASPEYKDPVPWPAGRVNFCFQGDFTDSSKLLFKRAMSSWDSTTPVWFNESLCGEGVYRINLTISQDYMIYSTLGYDPGDSNYMHIFTPDIIGFQAVAHELGHCLGLLHEHQRPDRDRYVKILWDNLDKKCLNQFVSHDNPLYLEESFPFDYKSIMSYGQYTCTKDDELPNMLALDDDWNFRIGPSSWFPNELDREKIRAIYDPHYIYGHQDDAGDDGGGNGDPDDLESIHDNNNNLIFKI